MVLWSRLAFFSSVAVCRCRISTPVYRTITTGFCSGALLFSPTTTAALEKHGRSSSSSSCPTTILSSMSTTTGIINAEDALALDMELMSTPGFTLEQLMELAGLSVAEAVYHVLTPNEDDKTTTKEASSSVLVVCGPGNNGGDGLVAARHLVHFGFNVTVLYPKLSTLKKPHYQNLVQQCLDMNIAVLEKDDDDGSIPWSEYSAMVDAIFGFSFRGTPREPFASILEKMSLTQQEHSVPLISVDVPSGWNVDGQDDGGDGDDNLLQPNVLVSLTAPKPASQRFKGRHFVGGRFLPPNLAQKYNIRMPDYPGVQQVVEIQQELI